MEEKIEAYWNDPQRERELVDVVTRLVNIRSVKGEAAPGMPYGPGPAAALEEGLALAKELGFATENYEGHVGLADLNDLETRLHILGHLDVVAEGTGWDTDPYTCVEKDGLLLGRGVADDKGPVACALLAMKAVGELGLPLSANVRMILGTDEESGSNDIAHYYSKEPYAPMAFTPDANFPVINIEKGHFHPTFGADWATEAAPVRVRHFTGGFRRNVVPPEATATIVGLSQDQILPACKAVEASAGVTFTVKPEGEDWVIHCDGVGAHAAYPQGGKNAISALLEVLAQLPLTDCASTRALRALGELFPYGDYLGKGLGVAQEDEESGPLTLNFSILNLDDRGFVGQFDARFPLCATEENCAQVCRDNFAAHGISIQEHNEMVPPHYVPADSPLVRTLLDCYSTYTGEVDPKPLAIGGGTYVHNIPGGVAYGCEFPGFDPCMHGANERIPVEHLLKACKIYTLAIARLCQ